MAVYCSTPQESEFESPNCQEHLTSLCQTTGQLLQNFRTQVLIGSGEHSGSYKVLGAVRKMGTIVCCLIFIWGNENEGNT